MDCLLLFFLYISDFRIQQSIFKTPDNTLVLDPAEKACNLQNTIEENRKTVGKTGDFLTMEQTKCKNFSKDQLKKHYGEWSKKTATFKFESRWRKTSRDNNVYDYDKLMRKS